MSFYSKSHIQVGRNGGSSLIFIRMLYCSGSQDFLPEMIKAGQSWGETGRWVQGSPCTAAVAAPLSCPTWVPASLVLFQQLSSRTKPSGEPHQPWECRELLEAAGWEWVSIPAQGTMGNCPPALGSCRWRGLPTPGLGGRGGRVLAHPREQAGGGVVAGQGTIAPWTRMLHATHHVQVRMPEQGAWCLQSGLCLCRAQ